MRSASIAVKASLNCTSGSVDPMSKRISALESVNINTKRVYDHDLGVSTNL